MRLSAVQMPCLHLLSFFHYPFFIMTVLLCTISRKAVQNLVYGLVLSCSFLIASTLYAQLRIIQPLASTPLLGGSNVEIRWENTTATTSSSDSVRLEFSTNGGTSWEYLATGRGGTYLWRNIPAQPMQQLRIRATELGVRIPYSVGQGSRNIGLSAAGSPSECAANSINTYPQAFWKPDGKQVALVAASWDNTNGCTTLVSTGTVVVRVFDVETGQMLRRFVVKRAITFDGQNRYSPIGYGYDNLGTQQNFWSPDGRLFTWWQSEGTLAVWDATNWNQLTTLQLPRIIGNTIYEYNTAWRPDGSTIFLYRLQSQLQADRNNTGVNPVALDRTILDWQLGTSAPRVIYDGLAGGRCMGQVRTNAATIIRDLGNNVQFSNNRQMAAIACGSGIVQIVNLQTQETVQAVQPLEITSIASDIVENSGQLFTRNMAWSPNDEVVAIWSSTGSNFDSEFNFDCQCNMRRIMLLNVRTGVRKIIRIPYVSLYWTNIAWSQDGRSLLVSGALTAFGARFDDGEAAVIDVPANGDVERASVRLWMRDFEQNASGTQYGRWNNQENLWNPDNIRLASGNSRRLDIWDTQRGDLLQTIQMPINTDFNRTVSWSPDGTRLLSTTRMRTNGESDFSAMIFSLPAPTPAVSDILSVVPVPLLAVPFSSSASYTCSTQGIMRIPFTNRGASELVISTASIQLFPAAVLPAIPAVANEFRILRLPERIPVGRTDTAIVAFVAIPERFNLFAFNPTARITAALSIRSNSTDSDQMTVILEGRKDSSGVEFSNGILDLPDIRAREIVQRSLPIRNTGSVPIQFPTREPITTGRYSRIINVVPNPILQGQQGFALVEVTAPQQITGRLLDEVRLQDGCGRSTTLSISLGRSSFIDAPDTTTFGVLCGPNPIIRIPLRNAGNAPLFINSINVVSGNSEEFPLVDLPSTIPSNATGILELGFNPRGIGTRSITVALETNAPNALRKLITVRVQKDTLNFRLSEQQVTLTTSLENTATSQTVRILNFGTTTLSWQSLIGARAGNGVTIGAVEPVETPPNGGSSTMRFDFRGGTAGFLSDTTLIFRQSGTSLTSGQRCEQSASLQVTARVIQLPRLAVQIPTMNLLCESNSVALLSLRNDGSADTRITAVTPRGQDAAEFTVEAFPQVVERGQIGTIRLRFAPRTLGTKQATLDIQSNAVDNVSNLALSARKDSSGLAVIEQRLDLGAVPVQTERTQTITLVNIGTVPQQISLPVTAGEFSLISVRPNPIPPNTRAQATVSFLARTGGTFAQRLVLRDVCNRETNIECTARAASGTASLQTSIDAAPAQEIEVPIFLRNRAGSGIGTRITAEIVIGNASMLEPVESMPPASNSVQNGIRTLTYSTALSSDNENEPVMRVKLRGLLGSDSVTTFRITSFVVGGVALPLASQTTPIAQVVMKGLNRSGGTRLFYATSPTLALKSISPNPSESALTLAFEASEEMDVRMRLVDMLGNQRAEWQKIIPKGSQNLALQTENVSAGAYMLEVQYICNSAEGRVCKVSRQVVLVR